MANATGFGVGSVFARRHDTDGWFWALVWVYAMLVVAVGFAPPIRERFFDDFQEPASLALVLHVWTFFGWLFLLALQAFLAGSGRLGRHRSLGMLMLPLAALMLWSGLTSELQFHRQALAGGRDFSAFFAVTATYLLTFAVLVPLAWWKRRDPPAHKRLMLLATAAILAGAHMRAWGDLWPEPWFDGSFIVRLIYFFGGSMIIVTFGVLHDLLVRRRLHPVYVVGAPSLLAGWCLAITLHDSSFWPDLVRPYLAG